MNSDWVYQLRLLQEFFIPRRCEVCGDIIEEGAFCPACRANFLLHKALGRQGILQNVYLLFKYEQQLRDLLTAVKFHQSTEYLRPLEEEAMVVMAEGWEQFRCQYDLVTWIPTSKDRLRQRGFDVPREIFRFFSKNLFKAVLERSRTTASLFSLNKEERKRELTGCFGVIRPVAGMRILLLDDIYTTGSTADEAAAELLRAGAKGVEMLAFSAGKANWG